MRSSIHYFSFALAAMMAASCSSTHKPAGTTAASATKAISLPGTKWVLQDLAGTPAIPNIKATLAFSEAGQVSGNASCNRFNGSVKISGTSLKFGPLAATRMACASDAVNDQETAYMKALGAATRCEWQGSSLLIYCDGYAKPLRFTPAAASAQP